MSSTESVSPHDVIVCACGTQEYTARDAIDAAIFRGELEDKWQKFLRHIAAEGRADELELELDESAISAAAEEFRYRHDLITAEETEAWLANRGLTFGDFSDYFARQYCVGAVDGGFSFEQIGYTSATPELRHLFVAGLILSGALEDMTIKFMWRLAARCAGNESTSEAIAAEKRKFLHRIGIKPVQLARWLEEMCRDSQWLNEMLSIEAVYGARCDTLLVPEARQRELMALRLRLTRFEIELIELESRDAAQGSAVLRAGGRDVDGGSCDGGAVSISTRGSSSGRPSGGCTTEIFKRLARGPAGTDAAGRRIRAVSHHQKSRAATRGSNRQITHRPTTA